MVESADAQRRTTRSSSRDRGDQQETRQRREAPADKMNTWYAISLGTLGFGSSFNISGKFSYAAKFENRFSVGAYGKLYYDLLNVINAPDIGLFSYGGGAFTRVNITDEIFLHGEYSYTDFEFATQNLNQLRESHIYPSVGGGYKAGYGNWTYGFHVLLPLKDRVRDFVQLEYWIDFNHKF